MEVAKKEALAPPLVWWVAERRVATSSWHAGWRERCYSRPSLAHACGGAIVGKWAEAEGLKARLQWPLDRKRRWPRSPVGGEAGAAAVEYCSTDELEIDASMI